MGVTNQRQGRRPVRARKARRAAERATRKKANGAERRGRRVAPTVAGFEAALQDHGYDGIAEALISRSNQRMQRMLEVGDMMQRIALPLLTSYLPLSLFAETLGANPRRAPCDSGTTWLDHLSWGLDSAAAAVRLILSLQPIGAGIIARTQLERWSSNREFNSDISQESGEDTVTWFNRLWTPNAESSNEMTPVGDTYAALSELLHARGPLMPLVWLDIDANDVPSSHHVKLLDRIGDALFLSLGQVRACIATAAEDAGWGSLAEPIFTTRLVSPAASWLVDLRSLLLPLVPSFFQKPFVERQLGTLASNYRQVISAFRAGQQPDGPGEAWSVFAFGCQRFRAFTLASWAYRHEREVLGDRSEEHGIEYLATDAVLAGEMAAMLAIWLRQTPGQALAADALAVCASGLRSAQWLWLEDDDRAMGCLRCVIEQLARARTWRLKPDRAAKIEASLKSTPRDWIEGAGWKRLNLLNRALGEFAHSSAGTNWPLARDALISLQDNAESDEAAHTGRTHALTALIFMVSVECAAWVDTFGGHLGAAYREIIRIDDVQADSAVEALMNRVWEKRGTPLR